MGKRLTALVMIALFFSAVISGCTGGPQDSSTVSVTAEDEGDTEVGAEPEADAPVEPAPPKKKLLLGCG